MELPQEIDKLFTEWSTDSFIDETEPGRALLATPTLHAKYLKILTFHSLKLKEITFIYNSKKNIKTEWYKGNLNNPEDLKEHGLEPQLNHYGTNRINDLLDSDKELIRILAKKAVHEEIVDAAKSIIKELNNRVWEIKSYIEWERFQGGR